MWKPDNLKKVTQVDNRERTDVDAEQLAATAGGYVDGEVEETAADWEAAMAVSQAQAGEAGMM